MVDLVAAAAAAANVASAAVAAGASAVNAVAGVAGAVAAFTTCSAGSEANCIALDATGCCLYTKVETVPAAPTVLQTAGIATRLATGFPTTAGATGYNCVTGVLKAAWGTTTADGKYTDPTSGIVFVSYCAGAMTKTAMAATAVVATVAATTF